MSLLCTFPSDFLSHAQLPRLVSTTEMYWGGGGGSCAPFIPVWKLEHQG